MYSIDLLVSFVVLATSFQALEAAGIRLINPRIESLDVSECAYKEIACNLIIKTLSGEYKINNLHNNQTTISKLGDLKPPIRDFRDIETTAKGLTGIDTVAETLFQLNLSPNITISGVRANFKWRGSEYTAYVRENYLLMGFKTANMPRAILSPIRKSLMIEYLPEITALHLQPTNETDRFVMTIADIAGQISQWILTVNYKAQLIKVEDRPFRIFRTSSFCDPIIGCDLNNPIGSLKDPWLKDNNPIRGNEKLANKLKEITEARRHFDQPRAITTIFASTQSDTNEGERQAMCWTSSQISFDGQLMKCAFKGEDQSKYVWQLDKQVEAAEIRALYIASGPDNMNNSIRYLHIAYSARKRDGILKNYYGTCIKSGDLFSPGKQVVDKYELRGDTGENRGSVGCYEIDVENLPTDIIGLRGEKCSVVIALFDLLYISNPIQDRLTENYIGPKVLEGLTFAYTAATSINSDIYFFTTFGNIIKARGSLSGDLCRTLTVAWSEAKEMTNRDFFNQWVYAEGDRRAELPGFVGYELEVGQSDTNPPILGIESGKNVTKPPVPSDAQNSTVIIVAAISAILGLLIVAAVFYIVCVRSEEPKPIKTRSTKTLGFHSDLNVKTVRSVTHSPTMSSMIISAENAIASKSQAIPKNSGSPKSPKSSVKGISSTRSPTNLVKGISSTKSPKSPVKDASSSKSPKNPVKDASSIKNPVNSVKGTSSIKSPINSVKGINNTKSPKKSGGTRSPKSSAKQKNPDGLKSNLYNIGKELQLSKSPLGKS